MYKIPPIIILVTEEDDAAFRSILKNKDSLFELGYRHINFELNCNETSEEFIQKWNATEKVKNSIVKQPIKEKFDTEVIQWHQILKGYYYVRGTNELLQNMLCDPHWSTSFIDIKKEEMFKPHSYELCSSLEILKPIREAKFAEEIIRSSEQYKGGTITIIGSNHYTVYDYLKKHNPQCAASTLFFVFQQYNPLLLPFSQSLSAETEKKRKESYQTNFKNRQDLVGQYFPKGSCFTLSISEPKHVDFIDPLFLRHIENKIRQLSEITVEQLQNSGQFSMK